MARGAMNENRFTVLVVGERRHNKAGLRAILDAAPRVLVVGEAESHQEAIKYQRRCRPDVVLIDTDTQLIDVRQLTEFLALGADGPPVNVLFLVNGMDETAWQLFRGGARGIVLRQAGPHQLIAALELVATGYVVLAYPRRPAAVDHLADRPAAAARRPDRPAMDRP